MIGVNWLWIDAWQEREPLPQMERFLKRAKDVFSQFILEVRQDSWKFHSVRAIFLGTRSNGNIRLITIEPNYRLLMQHLYLYLHIYLTRPNFRMSSSDVASLLSQQCISIFSPHYGALPVYQACSSSDVLIVEQSVPIHLQSLNYRKSYEDCGITNAELHSLVAGETLNWLRLKVVCRFITQVGLCHIIRVRHFSTLANQIIFVHVDSGWK